jgi:hypothetical protein
MPFDLTFDHKPGYLHAIVTGVNSPQAVLGYLAAVERECGGRGERRVLIEERLTGPRLGAVDVLNIVEEGSRSARNSLAAIAYVDVYAEGPLMKLAEDAAVNRGVRVAIFRTLAEAETWLGADIEASGAG